MVTVGAGSMENNEGSLGQSAFRTTHWSVISAAGAEDSVGARKALEQLCTLYWFPIYAFIRRWGHSTHAAQDLTQDFFFRLLDKRHIERADRNRGRFRTFLLTSVKHFLADQHDRAHAEKRGGGQVPVSIDVEIAEGRYLAEPVENETPEKVYERRWANTLLERVVAQLGADFAETGKSEFFKELTPFLWGRKSGTPYREIGDRFGMTESAVKMTVSRLREKYRQLLQVEIAHTVATPEEIEDEIRHLISVFSS